MHDPLKKIILLLWTVVLLQIVLIGFVASDVIRRFHVAAADEEKYQRKLSDWQKSMDAWKGATEIGSEEETSLTPSPAEQP